MMFKAIIILLVILLILGISKRSSDGESFIRVLQVGFRLIGYGATSLLNLVKKGSRLIKHMYVNHALKKEKLNPRNAFTAEPTKDKVYKKVQDNDSEIRVGEKIQIFKEGDIKQ